MIEIGKTAKELYRTLSANLTGPLETILPRQWIDEAIEKAGAVFRNTAFSPSRDYSSVDSSGA